MILVVLLSPMSKYLPGVLTAVEDGGTNSATNGSNGSNTQVNDPNDIQNGAGPISCKSEKCSKYLNNITNCFGFSGLIIW